MDVQITAPTSDSMGRILLVDDNADQLELLTALMEAENYTVVTAGSAAEGLEILRHRPIDMLITDICMPEINGMEFAKQVRSLPCNERILIVLMTAGSEPIDFASYHYRVDAFCLKRQVRQILLPCVNSLMEGKNH